MSISTTSYVWHVMQILVNEHDAKRTLWFDVE